MNHPDWTEAKPMEEQVGVASKQAQVGGSAAAMDGMERDAWTDGSHQEKEVRCAKLREAVWWETRRLPRCLQPRAARGPEFMAVLRDVAQAGNMRVEQVADIGEVVRELHAKFKALDQLEPTRDAKDVLDKAQVVVDGAVELHTQPSYDLEAEDLLALKDESEESERMDLRTCNLCGRPVLAAYMLKHAERCRRLLQGDSELPQETPAEEEPSTGERHWLVPPVRRKRSKDRTRPASALKLTRKMMVLRTTITYRNSLKTGCKSFGLRTED